jgi:hypothetical protein
VLFIEQALSIKEPWVYRALIWVALVLIGPALFGMFLGVAIQKEWFGWIPRKLNIVTIHVIPTAWDWKFSKIPRGGQFIMITLTNGEKVAGFFGPNSFASSTGGRPLPLPQPPKGVQGGYQAPSGGAKPNPPTTGSGVQKK